MSANINSMAYAGETPWHKLGTKVDSEMTSAEAIVKGGLDWAVTKEPIYFHGKDGLEAIKDRFAIVRQDTKVVLGTVGARYTPLQNKGSFQFFDSIVGEKLAMYHTVGSLGKGERIWLLAKLPGSIWVTPEDNIEKYLLLSNSHDGTSSVQVMVTPIRVVCQNTLNAAIDATKHKSRIRHTMNMGNNINDLRKQLGIVDAYYNMFEEMSKHLVNKKANSYMVEAVLSDLGLSATKAEESTRMENIRYDILRRFEKGMGNDLPSIKGSAWSLWNGIVEWVDYSRGSDKNRGESLLYTTGADIKQQSLNKILELVA